ncbi:MAG: hypothetical protein AAF915_12840 [Cyanobacteria bacterium P01_D01_bin.50]
MHAAVAPQDRTLCPDGHAALTLRLPPRHFAFQKYIIPIPTDLISAKVLLAG